MANIIRVTPQKLRQTAQSFQATGEQIRSLTGEMTGTVRSLSGRVWSGDAALAYTTRFRGLYDDITAFSKTIREHVSKLTQIAAEYERAESANRQDAAQLAKDVF